MVDLDSGIRCLKMEILLSMVATPCSGTEFAMRRVCKDLGVSYEGAIRMDRRDAAKNLDQLIEGIYDEETIAARIGQAGT